VDVLKRKDPKLQGCFLFLEWGKKEENQKKIQDILLEGEGLRQTCYIIIVHYQESPIADARM